MRHDTGPPEALLAGAPVRDRLPDPGIQARPGHDPQLVVVRGLLLDHQQKTESEARAAVLATRVARASYGVVVREAYSSARHFDEEVIRDPFDGRKLWAVNQIEWMIRKGDTTDTGTPLVKTFQSHMAERDTQRSWVTDIVVASADLRFELWLGGERFSGNHEPIGVAWDAGDAGDAGKGAG
ncbi:hypothetical protein E4U53_008167 [Claviceps sorghi]|nr:hypothetical protein E4U53_008167 [Claviceps sorghi]